MEELGQKQKHSRLYSEIQGSIHLANNSSFHSKTKNIHLEMYHFIRSILEDELLKFENIHTSQNLADMLTKVVTIDELSSCSVSIGLQA